MNNFSASYVGVQVVGSIAVPSEDTGMYGFEEIHWVDSSVFPQSGLVRKLLANSFNYTFLIDPDNFTEHWRLVRLRCKYGCVGIQYFHVQQSAALRP